MLPASVDFKTEAKPGLLNGVTVINATTPVVEISEDGLQVSTTQKNVTLIPYYAWANRGKGEMIIWFPTKVKDMDLITTGNKLEENKSK